MLKQLTFLFALLACLNVFAQDFPVKGAKWVYYAGAAMDPWEYGYAEFECVGDTILGSDTCTQIVRTYITKRFTAIDIPTERMIYKRKNGIVYHWNEPMQKFDLVMDYNLAQGDSFWLDLDSCHVQVYIDTIITDLYNGVPLKTFVYSDTAQSTMFWGAYTERIGALPMERGNCANYQADADFLGGLCSYEDSVVGIYSAPANPNDCKKESVGIEERQRTAFKIYPNPSHNILHIETNYLFGDYKLQILNTLGDVVLTRSGSYKSALQLQHELPPGVYQLHFCVGMDQFSQKLIVPGN